MTRDQILEIARKTPDVGAVKHEEFADYVMPLSQRKKDPNGEWLNLEVPYMTVDGRVMMAQVDHARQGKKIDFLTPDVLINNDDEITLLVTIVSEVYGARHGIATSSKNPPGDQRATPENLSPWEVAETSAIGRALGFFGYGVFSGSGIPSANDMQRASARDRAQSNARPAAPARQENKPAPAPVTPHWSTIDSERKAAAETAKTLGYANKEEIQSVLGELKQYATRADAEKKLADAKKQKEAV